MNKAGYTEMRVFPLFDLIITDGRTDGRTNGWKDGRMDGRTDGPTDRQTKPLIELHVRN